MQDVLDVKFVRLRYVLLVEAVQFCGVEQRAIYVPVVPMNAHKRLSLQFLPRVTKSDQIHLKSSRFKH